jgi:hypothetical protein
LPNSIIYHPFGEDTVVFAFGLDVTGGDVASIEIPGFAEVEPSNIIAETDGSGASGARNPVTVGGLGFLHWRRKPSLGQAGLNDNRWSPSRNFTAPAPSARSPIGG